ncbi:c-type cytochrome [Fluviispira multicolorata]|uniref:C-type cytochrome n=1 Tax=Fluviispira multicolorata TaxID=2654512 RepID=A0A833JHY0_9BACT|nr:c-type cytochrome [Fluviispira multicolorata]KAB8033702.1 c-type cytochrome [Fluviispira multicolorata]
MKLLKISYFFIALTSTHCYSQQETWDLKKYPLGTKITNINEAKSLVEKIEKRKKQAWIEPNKNELPKGKEGELIRYGIELVTNTSQLIGPKAKKKELRISANNLDCVHCHQVGLSGLPGTKKYSIPWINSKNEFPQLDIKSMTVKSIETIIRGMLGTTPQKMSNNTKEMKAIVAYINWLGKKTQLNMNMENTKLDNRFNLPKRASNPIKGKALYNTLCSSCHGIEGLGLKKADFEQGGGYQFPPVAGDDTYSDGGHMYMIPLLTSFLYTNMPMGATHDNPILKIDDAYDISSYINNNLKRKHDSNRMVLYPFKELRPEGFAIPEHFKNSNQEFEKAKFGPFQSKFWW